MLWETAVKIGLPVFPCRPNKAPCGGSHGFKDAQTDPKNVRKLFLQHPQATLIGVPTGTLSGFDALDLDTARHQTAVSFLHHISPVYSRTHQTQSGGFHFLFKHIDGRNNTAGTKHRKGVDIRGDGGYIIWWPAFGYAVNPYPIADWPAAIIALFAKPKRISSDEPIEISEGRLGSIVRKVACAREGTRNNLLFWAACRVGEGIKSGAFDRTYGEKVLLSAAEACGLDKISADKTIASGIKCTSS